MIIETWRGYEVSRERPGNRFPVYVKSIRKGKVTWTTDYTYAAHYSKATAIKHDNNIRTGVYEEA